VDLGFMSISLFWGDRAGPRSEDALAWINKTGSSVFPLSR
jgi:hypothetical protein